jgi:hypothetical protein
MSVGRNILGDFSMTLTRACRGIAFLLSLALAPAPALAKDEDKFVELFLGVCVNNTPHYMDKLKAGAEVMDWKKLEGAAAMMMAPSDPNAEFVGWLVTWKEALFMVGATKGIENGDGVTTCAVAGQHALPEPTELLLSKHLKLSVIGDTTEAGQRFQIWKSEFAGSRVDVMQTSATDGLPPVILSIMSR